MSKTPLDFETDAFDQWREYPATSENAQLGLDLDDSRRWLKSDVSRLFVSDADSKPELLNLDQTDPSAQIIKPEHFTSAERLEQELIRISPRRDLRVFYITQAFSWSRLLVSQDHCLKLFTFLKVNPSFLNILHTSGEKIAPVEESFAAHFTRIFRPVSADYRENVSSKRGYELGYNMKYVEKHGRRMSDPYSLRETGVYHRWDSVTQEGDWLFMQPSKSMKRVIESRFRNTPSKDSAFEIHATVLLKASENWRFYINHLEDVFSKIVDRGFFTNIQGPSYDGDIDADFSDIRKLQILTDKLRRLSHVLHMNAEIGLAIRDFGRRLRAAWGKISEDDTVTFEETDSCLEQFLFEHRTHKSRIDSLLERAAGISLLVRTILNFRDVDSNNKIVQSLRDTTLQGVIQNRKLESLSVSSARDTRSMMIIALITTIFLPATFVATLFGSNFFGFESSAGSGNELKVAANIWIYVVVTFVLLVFTVGGGWLCWLRSRPKRNIKSMVEEDKDDSIDLEVGRLNKEVSNQKNEFL